MTAKQFIEEQQEGVLLNDYTLTDTIWFMNNYSQLVLKIAAEKATIRNTCTDELYSIFLLDNGYDLEVDRESILNCLKD